MILWVICLLILLLYVLIVPLIAAKNPAPDVRLPGPRSLPMIGNLFDVGIGKSHEKLMELSQHHGPIYKLRFMNENCVVVTSLPLIMEASVEKGNHFSGRPSTFRVKRIVEVVGALDFGDLDDIGRIWKKISARSVRPNGEAMTELEPVSTEICQDLLNSWSSSSGTAKYLNDDLARFTSRLLLRFMVKDYGGPKSTSVEMLLQLEDVFFNALDFNISGMLLDTYPWLRYFGNRSWKLIKKSFKMADNFYDLNKKIVIENNKKCILQMLLSDASKTNVSDEDRFVKGTLVSLTVGALATTNTLIHTIIGVLAHHPHIQKVVQDEVEGAVGDRMPTITDRKNMPYTEALILDVMRNTRVTGLRKATRDTTLGGYHIPAGVTVLLSLWSIHHDPNFWQDPYAFKPERFLDPEGHLVTVDHPNRRQILPFGAGPRSCPGEAFARGRLFLFIAMFCQRFTVTPEGYPDPATMDPRRYEVQGLLLLPPLQKYILEDRRQ